MILEVAGWNMHRAEIMAWSSALGQSCGSECGLTGTQASACAGSLSVGPEQPVWGTLEEREKRREGGGLWCTGDLINVED